MAGQFDEARAKASKVLGESVVKELAGKGYEAEYVASKEEALAAVLKLIPSGASVGVPGTVTIREIGAMEKLAERGCKIYQHWNPSLTPAERGQVLADENAADYFLTSSNAITRDGKLVNIDGNGNRVSGMAWGRSPIIYVIGINKVTANLDEAISRARGAAIPNVLRLNGSTPCSQAGHCVDCNSPARICNALLIMERAAGGRKSHVIIVGENLGF
ncbi:hypothetical protein AGMMS49957_07830 [Synergistales bacterium]|nr:hypothetical protein AGMMS49957_07830 [Synergistales bacterium]